VDGFPGRGGRLLGADAQAVERLGGSLGPLALRRRGAARHPLGLHFGGAVELHGVGVVHERRQRVQGVDHGGRWRLAVSRDGGQRGQWGQRVVGR